MPRRLRFSFLALTLIAMLAGLTRSESSIAIVYHGNAKSHVFHAPDCRYYDCSNCTVEFASGAAAVAAGYRPCKVCEPSTVGEKKAQREADRPTLFVGNTQSHIFHLSSCRYFGCKHCTVFFKSRDDAIDAGYRPGKCCDP